MVLTQLSDGGSSTHAPTNTITLNGLTFSTCVACRFLISLATCAYFNVIKSPVFWQFASNNLRLEFKSAESGSIPGSNATSALNDQKSTALISWLFATSTSHLDPSSLLKSTKSLFLKLLTTKPLLNLSKPSQSFTCKD